jgi:hypothetical protein
LRALTRRCLPKAGKFPRVYRHTLTQRLMEAALNLQELFFDAQVREGAGRLEQLRRADAELNKLRLYLRIAHRLRWLNDGQYRHVSTLVAEIGRMLGGWTKATARAVSPASAPGYPRRR